MERLFSSLTTEVEDQPLPVHGSLPDWLQGSLYRNGPALFEIGSESFNHWFDGQAMLHRFAFDARQVQYTNRLLRTEHLKAHLKAGRVAVREVGTSPTSGLFTGLPTRLMSAVRPGIEYDNNNVSVKLMNGRLVALSETPLAVEFTSDLHTHGTVQFEDHLKGTLSTAHPHTLEDGRHLNYLTKFGKTTQYVLYTTPGVSSEPVGGGLQDGNGGGVGSVVRTEVARVTVDSASYMHSFGVSADWYVLCEFPWKFELTALVLGTIRYVGTGGHFLPFPDAFVWRPEQGTIFTLVHRHDKRIVRVKAPAFFAYHHVNCVDNSDGTVSVDMMCYAEPGYDGLTLDQLRSGQSLGAKFEDGGQLQRWVIDPVKNTSTMSVLYDGLCELPTINYAKNTQTYEYVYGVGSMQQTLVKVDVSTGQTQVWGEEGCVVGEPIYVPRPGAVAEDEGVVLSIVFDTLSQCSCLLVLDGQSFVERARAQLTHHIPAQLHGLFVPSNRVHVGSKL